MRFLFKTGTKTRVYHIMDESKAPALEALCGSKTKFNRGVENVGIARLNVCKKCLPDVKE